MFYNHAFSTVRIGLASLLPDHLLYSATCAGLTYIRIIQLLDEEKALVHVAPLAHRLDMSGKYFTCILTGEQLAQTLPSDQRLEQMPICDLLETVERHVATVRALAVAAIQQLQSQQRERVAEEFSAEHPDLIEQEAEEAEGQPKYLDEIAVSYPALEKAFETMPFVVENWSYRLARLWLLRSLLLHLEQVMLLCSERERATVEQSIRKVHQAFTHRRNDTLHLEMTPLYQRGRRGLVWGCVVRLGFQSPAGSQPLVA